MMRRTLLSLSLFIFYSFVTGAQTLEECQKAAERNYPLIKQYDLIGKTTGLTLKNISKGWLPQVSALAQATWQTDVTAFPEQMQALYQQAGIEMKGLRKDQYRVGIDVQQMVFDGGATKYTKEIARRQGAVEEAQTEVTLYQVRRRVNELYFGLLLIDEQLRLNSDVQALLASSEKQLQSMYEHGTAAESDYLSVKAERLNVVQQATALQSQSRSLKTMLEAFCGMEIKSEELRVKSEELRVKSKELRVKSEELRVKSEEFPSGLPTLAAANSSLSTLHSSLQRPELKVIEAQLRLADAQEAALDAALLPKLGVFAQGYYGSPGYNLFEDMMHHQWSWNGMIGARLTWNIGALYTRKNDKAKILLRREMAETSRDVFIFNNRLEQIQQNESIDSYRRLMADDDEIIELRASVRKAAESKLAHGIIDVNGLIKEINAENSARVQKTVHAIELQKEIYDLKYTTNN